MNLGKQFERSAPFALMVMWLCLIAGPTVWVVGSALKPSMKSSEVASWVQAIGSIGAIVGTFVVSHRQFAKQAILQSKQAVKKMHAYIAVISHAVEQCRRAYEEESEPESKGNVVGAWNGGYAQTFNSILASLGLLAAHELEDPELVVAYTFILGEMTNISRYFTDYSKIDEPDELDEEYFLVSLECSFGIIEMHWSSFERYLDENPIA